MMRRLGVLFLICLFPLAANAAELQRDVRVRTALRILDAWLESQQEYSGTKSISVGLVHDQNLIWAGSYGLADPERGIPATPDTIYRIASNSKLFTAVALMKLQEEGRLTLNDAVARWVPELEEMEGGLFKSRAITIADLLSHTSGLPREVNSPAWAELDFPSSEEVLAGLAGQRAVYGPGTRLKYSNLAYTLAGLVVERAAGEPYAAFVRRAILEPLGMTHTGVDRPDGSTGAVLAVGYSRRMPDGSRRRLPWTPTRAMAPATGLYSSVRDFARFQAWQFRLLEADEAEVILPDSLKEMQRMHWFLPNTVRGWGLGFRITRTVNGPLVGHGGLIHGFRTATGILPADKIGLIVFTSSDDGEAQGILDRAAELLVPPLREAADKIKKPQRPEKHWPRLTGLYRGRLSDLKIIIGDRQLVGVVATAPDPRIGLLRLNPIGPYEFRIETAYSGQPGEIARFAFDGNGRVERLYLGSHYLERVAD